MFYRKFIKRPLDFLIAGLGIVLSLPISLPIAIVLYFAHDGSVFFRQARPGKHGKIFRIRKFKTMNDRVDNKGQLLPDEQRLTTIGRFVRKTSMDELPQLLNVLNGDISLVGPRPLLVQYLELYTPFQARRHQVRPGITGLAQVNGRNQLSWEEKFEFDVYYVENQSLLLDLKILFRTVWNVLTARGINAGDAATMKAFGGSPQNYQPKLPKEAFPPKKG